MKFLILAVPLVLLAAGCASRTTRPAQTPYQQQLEKSTGYTTVAIKSDGGRIQTANPKSGLVLWKGHKISKNINQASTQADTAGLRFIGSTAFVQNRQITSITSFLP